MLSCGVTCTWHTVCTDAVVQPVYFAWHTVCTDAMVQPFYWRQGRVITVAVSNNNYAIEMLQLLIASLLPISQ